MSAAPKIDASVSPCRELVLSRARMYADIRAFFHERGVLEVETPVFSLAGNTDPAIDSVVADFSSPFENEASLRYAHTSPEFAMKRLLAAGSGAIYQICKVFRKEECGRLHRPEFSMLEWYRPGMSYHALMDELAELLAWLMPAGRADTERISYADLFQRELKLDVLSAGVAELKDCAHENGLEVVGFDDDYDNWASLLLANLIEPGLGVDNPVFVYDYPSSQAALAQIRHEDNIAERFELYINGVEIANGYQELTDAQIYLERFENDNKKRKLSGLAEIKVDHWLIKDILSGFPDSSGVALGLDRLLMVMLNAVDIQEVLHFHVDDI